MPENEPKIIEACQDFLQKNNKCRLVFTSLLSSLSQIANLKDMCSNILHFINILCIASKERFIKNIKDHYEDEKTNPFFDQLFLHEKLYKRTKKALDKILAKHNKNKSKAQ